MMKTVEIIGYNRANLGKTEAKRLREEGNVPSVLYGGKDQVHFYSPMILFRDLVYTDQAHFVKLNLEGVEYDAILQDIQFHPVSEVILHADFLLLDEKKIIKMNVPVQTTGIAPGIQQGGKLIKKLRHLAIKALPKNMPAFIEINVSKLGLGKSFKVGEIVTGDYEIVNNKQIPVLGIEIPRALKGKTTGETAEGEEEEAATEETAEA